MCVSHYGSPILDLHLFQAKQCCFSFCFVLTLLVWQRNLPFFFIILFSVILVYPTHAVSYWQLWNVGYGTPTQ